MKIILTEDVEKLGKEGEVVDVADGYARNYLLPRKKAVEATRQKVKELKKQKKRKKKKENEKIEEAKELAAEMEKKEYEFSVKAGEQGRLFGSVTSKDIAEKMADKGFEVDKKDIQLDQNIKSLGVHKVPIKLYEDVSAKIKVKVVEA